MTACVYILASAHRGTLHVGVTSNLPQRACQHREHVIDGVNKRYGVTRHVYYKAHDTMESAIRREKQMKLWKRAWKIKLIERQNPDGLDLFQHTAT